MTALPRIREGLSSILARSSRFPHEHVNIGVSESKGTQQPRGPVVLRARTTTPTRTTRRKHPRPPPPADGEPQSPLPPSRPRTPPAHAPPASVRELCAPPGRALPCLPAKTRK